MILFIAIIFAGCAGGSVPTAPEQQSAVPVSALPISALTEQEPNIAEYSEVSEVVEDDINNTSANDILFDGLLFRTFELFEVETIAEGTQYHLDENMRNDPSVIDMLEYHMGESVLFVPIIIVNTEIGEPSSVSPGYRFRPEIRRWTPSSSRSLFEADTLNGRKIFQLATLDEIPNQAGAFVHGYLPFAWEGYGEYRAEIIRDNEAVDVLVFNVDSNSVVYSVFEASAESQQVNYQSESVDNINSDEVFVQEPEPQSEPLPQTEPPTPTLVGTWFWMDSPYYVLDSNGRGTMAGTDIRWSARGNVLSICNTPSLCGNTCRLPTEWNYAITGNQLTLTSRLVPGMSYTYTRQTEALSQTELLPPPPSSQQTLPPLQTEPEPPPPVQGSTPSSLPQSETSQGVMVWLSATGSRWHSINNCGTMNPARARQVTIEYARSNIRLDGPCNNCNPPR